MAERRPSLEQLRSRAEAALARGEVNLGVDTRQWLAADVRELVEELRVYQAELEMQNDALRTAQTLSERALSQYTLLFRALPLPALVLDDRGLIQQANRAAIELFGFGHESQAISHSAYRLLEEDDRGSMLSLLQNSEQNDPYLMPGLRIRAAERVMPMDMHIIRLSSEYHLDAHTLILLVDRSHEEEREKERLLFQSMLDNSPSLMFAFDLDGRCLLANEALLRVLRTTRDKLLGHRRGECMSAEDAAQHRVNDLHVIDSGVPLTYEEKLHWPGEGDRYFFSNKFPLRDLRGGIFGIGGVTTEITDIRKAELQLQLAMRVFSQGSEGIVITDPDNRIISVNRAFVEVTGYQEAEAVGQLPSLLKSGRQDKAFYERMWSSLNTTGFWEGEIWNKRKNGEIYPEWLTISRILSADGKVQNYVAVFNDITKRKLAESEIERLAFFDSLTGTPNRHLLQDRVNQAISRGKRSNDPFVLMFMDLDRFKEINDSLGHDVGDELLIEVARRLQNSIRAEDTVSRLGGDEFVLLLNRANEDIALFRVEQCLQALREPFVIATHQLALSASIGIALYPRDGHDFSTLLKHADLAMYNAKHSGRNGYSFYRPELGINVSHRASLEVALRNALDKGEFHLVYQPQVSLLDGSITGFEALLRWHNDEHGNPSPDIFVPILEESGQIVEVGKWVLHTALGQARQLLDLGLEFFSMAINISASQIRNAHFVSLVSRALEETGVPAHHLELELTERLAMHDPGETNRFMKNLSGRGVRFSVDDFGTGHSSLAYLHKLALDVIKIDRSFVSDIGLDQGDEMIVRAIVGLAKILRLGTIAEGVETAEQEAFLKAIGCGHAQGYRYAKPMPGAELMAWVAGRIKPRG